MVLHNIRLLDFYRDEMFINENIISTSNGILIGQLYVPSVSIISVMFPILNASIVRCLNLVVRTTSFFVHVIHFHSLALWSILQVQEWKNQH